MTNNIITKEVKYPLSDENYKTLVVLRDNA